MKKSKRSKPKKSHSAGSGKWMLLANIARLLSVSVDELVLKVPKAAIGIKDVRVDISRTCEPSPILNIKLYLIHLLVQLSNSQLSFDHSSFEQGACFLNGQNYAVTTEKESAAFICEDFLVACKLGYDSDQGIKIKNLDFASGDITVNLNENLSLGTKKKSEVPSGADANERSADITAAKMSPDNKLSSVLRKHIIPDKVSFNLPKLDVKFMHQGQRLSVENNVMGVHLRCIKSITCDDSGDPTSHFDVQLGFSKIHLLREGATSILEISEFAIIVLIDVTKEPLLPVRTEVDVKLGVTCNVIMSRLKPWLQLHLSKKKKMVLRDEKVQTEKPKTSSPITVLWTCSVSAPELTFVIYDLNDFPFYHATCFQPQMQQDVYVGRWWKVRMLRSASGTTPAMKPYFDLPLHFHKGDVSFGVSYEPVFADISYAFTVALRRAFLGTKGINPLENQPPRKERSLPWWDDMRYYIHGKIGLYFSETRWNLLATTDPYEKVDKVHIVSGYMEIQQSDGHVSLSTREFKAYASSLEGLTKNSTLKPPCYVSEPFLYFPAFSVDVLMDWECDSCCPHNHYLHALPKEGKPRDKVYDPFRSTALSLRWNFSVRPSLLPNNESSQSSCTGDSSLVDGATPGSLQKLETTSIDSPTVSFGVHDLAWLFKWLNMYYLPPNKLRFFSRWPRFGVPRVVRSGNLALDKVMTEFFLRLDITPTCIKHMPLVDDDPASGLTFRMTKLKVELCFSRGKQKFTFDCIRDPLDLVYQGVDLHLPKVYLNRNDGISVAQDLQTSKISSQTVSIDDKSNHLVGRTQKRRDDGFLLYSDYFTIRKQAPKADAARILAWQEAGRRNLEVTRVKSEFGNESESDHLSDEDGFNVVVADNCLRVFVYGLKLLWMIEHRNAILSLAAGMAKAFAPRKPSPSCQYAQRKLEEQQMIQGCEMLQHDAIKLPSSAFDGTSSPSIQNVEATNTQSSPSPSTKVEPSTNVIVNHGQVGDSEEDGIRHFMVNIIQPQFNLHSEEAKGRFLLAAASGRVLARSFHSVLHVGYEMIKKANANYNATIPETEPEMTWKRVELSVMLEQVQAHVAPTDVDPGAGVQWLPKILNNSPKVIRTGALLERVFMPCQMYFQYTRHKGGTPELKVKPLKELKFNSPNITATMTSRQFQVMMDVLTNLLFARVPKPRKSSLLCPTDDEDIEEEADEIIPDGVEEVELARIEVEQKERDRKLLLDDIRMLSVTGDLSGDLGLCPETDGELWMVTGGKSILVHGLKKELGNLQKSRKEASSALRMAVHKAAQLHLMEKEKNKSPSYAMRVSMRISKVVWGMLVDGKPFAETEINDMIYDFDRDYKDIGIALFTTKSIVVKNCLPNAKSDTLLSAWNAPPEWGKNVMLRVNAKQGPPKDGNSALELFQVDIYPLKIYLTESMYRVMWGYFFPEEEQVSHRRQEVWKVSTAGSKRVKKSISGADAIAPSSQSTKESEVPGKSIGDSSQVLKLPKGKMVSGSNPEHRRTSSSDKTWEENVANELVQQMHSSKDSKPVRSGRSSQEEKKFAKSQDDKSARPQKMMEFHNIKISQVELLLTYEGSRFVVSDLRLLMDSFRRDEFTGTWRRLFSRVKKHIIWGVLKSVTGMQVKKFKGKSQSQKEPIVGILPEGDLNLSDSDGDQPGKSDQLPAAWLKRPNDGAGDGFVTSVRGLFNNQRRKAKAFAKRTMKGDADNELQGEWSENDVEFAPFARQLTITKAKKLIRRHKKNLRSKSQKNSDVHLQEQEPDLSSPRETSLQSDSSTGSSSEEINEQLEA